MAVLPFGMWQVGDAFYEAVDLEDEEEDQYEEESADKRNDFIMECTDFSNLIGDLLVIAIGTASTTFIETFIDLPKEAVGELICSNVDGEVKCKKLQQQTSLLYKLDKKIICQCKSFVKPEDNHNWVKQLISYVQPKNVVVLSSQTKTSFQGDLGAKNSDSDVLRHLKTSSLSTGVSPLLLEHGTVISGLPAAIMSYCEIFDVHAVLYVSFTESHFVDVFSLKTYEQVLNDELLKELPQVSKSVVSQKLKYFDGVGVADNNLYI